MTKLAAIYNIFDGEELIASSIESIRNSVDVVIVVQQQTSNFGNVNNRLGNFLKKIKTIDLIIDYEPDTSVAPEKNEFNKRIIGLKKAIEIGCTHYLYVDCDEEYREFEFKNAFKKILETDSDSSAVDIINYFKFKDLKIEEPAGMYVPFIHKIQKGKMMMSMNSPYPVLVDKTRKGGSLNNFMLFEKKDICMHHYSWVRKDIRRKIENSTARMAFEKFKEQIIISYNDFTREQKLVKIGSWYPLPESILTAVPFRNFKYVDTSIIK